MSNLTTFVTKDNFCTPSFFEEIAEKSALSSKNIAVEKDNGDIITYTEDGLIGLEKTSVESNTYTYDTCGRCVAIFNETKSDVEPNHTMILYDVNSGKEVSRAYTRDKTIVITGYEIVGTTIGNVAKKTTYRGSRPYDVLYEYDTNGRVIRTTSTSCVSVDEYASMSVNDAASKYGFFQKELFEKIKGTTLFVRTITPSMTESGKESLEKRGARTPNKTITIYDACGRVLRSIRGTYSIEYIYGDASHVYIPTTEIHSVKGNSIKKIASTIKNLF